MTSKWSTHAKMKEIEGNYGTLLCILPLWKMAFCVNCQKGKAYYRSFVAQNFIGSWYTNLKAIWMAYFWTFIIACTHKHTGNFPSGLSRFCPRKPCIDKGKVSDLFRKSALERFTLPSGEGRLQSPLGLYVAWALQVKHLSTRPRRRRNGPHHFQVKWGIISSATLKPMSPQIDPKFNNLMT